MSALLKKASKGITELTLKGNQLTVSCFETLIQFPKLIMLDLSYNKLGYHVLQKLPVLLEHLPALIDIRLEGTQMGNLWEIDMETKDAYTSYDMNTFTKNALSLNLSENHFQGDMLWHWTTLWIHIKQMCHLTMSNVTSEAGWDNMFLLSDLPRYTFYFRRIGCFMTKHIKWYRLSDLNLSCSAKSTFTMCVMPRFFSMKQELEELDFSCCDLTSRGKELEGSVSCVVK